MYCLVCFLWGIYNIVTLLHGKEVDLATEVTARLGISAPYNVRTAAKKKLLPSAYFSRLERAAAAGAAARDKMTEPSAILFLVYGTKIKPLLRIKKCYFFTLSYPHNPKK